jgi:6-phosphofructokinase 1
MDIIRFYRDELGEEPPSFVEAGPRETMYHSPGSARVAMLTSGGIAPGLNTVVESIVERHVGVYGLRLGPLELGMVLGFQDGFAGLEENRYEELDPEKVRGWCQLGASKLGVGRGKRNVQKWLDVLRRNDIDILYVIGGNGSLTGAWELAKEVERKNLNLSIGVVPKTMDNDILWVWQSFGFVTAFDKATEMINVLHTEAESNRRVCVIQLFGAKSGHVAANASLGSGDVDAVLIPEEDFEVELLCRHIKRRVSRFKHAVIVLAEGARGIEKKGAKWYRWQVETRKQRDANFHRMQTVVKEALEDAGLDRHGVFGNQPQHVIRSVVPNSHDQVYCRRLADMIVDSCLGGYTNFMISFWLTECVLVPLNFSARGGLTKEGYKTFPTGGIFWRTVLRSTGQPSFLSQEIQRAIENGKICDWDEYD